VNTLAEAGDGRQHDLSLALVLTDEVIDAFDHVFYYLLSSV